MFNLKNKISIITGASSGIGRESAILFSKLGSRITLLGRNEKELDATVDSCLKFTEKDNILKIVGDLTDNAVREKTVNNTISKFGKLNVLVNNAAIFRMSNLLNTKMVEFDEIMNVNVRSVFMLTQLCVPYLIKENNSSIVNVSSIAGTRCFPGLLPYSMSKAALDQFTKVLSLELANYQCRVNSVNPGTIITNIHRRAGYTEAQYKIFLEACKKTHALGRPGNSDEVANTIAFLASDNASFITGELIHVDGGRQNMSPR